MRSRTLHSGCAAAAILLVAAAAARAQTAVGTAFTYQGRLADGGSPANGSYDFEFKLHDDPAAGNQVGSTITVDDQPVTNGLFTVNLDFGTGIFTGDARHLEIAVRPGAGSEPYTVLSPRQELTPTPHALWAQNVPWAGVTGAPGGGFWQLGGNAGTTPGTHFLGTTDGNALFLNVANEAALRLYPTTMYGQPAPNVIGGRSNNAATAGAGAATIAGGGGYSTPNIVSEFGGTVGGGENNVAGNQDGNAWDQRFPTVAGGASNTASNGYAAVGGGFGNTASGYMGTVPGGGWNAAAGWFSLAAGLRAKANHNGTFVWGDNTDADFASTGNNQFLIRASGGVGIGTTTPGFPLTFADAEGDKISLFGQSGNHYGFGIQSYLLQIHGASSSSDIAFGHGSSASFTEVMRVKGSGNVGIGTPGPNGRLNVNGDGTSPSLRVQVSGASKLTVAANGGVSIGGFQDSPPTNGLVVAGDVLLANGVISAGEISDEPGVASAKDTTSPYYTYLDGTVQTLVARSITLPTSGYVLAIATCEAMANHTSGTDSTAVLAVSDTSGSYDEYVHVGLDSALNTGSYTHAVTVHNLFTAAAGSRTFYLVGREAAGSDWGVKNMRLTLAFFPTAYGTITSALEDGSQGSSDGVVEADDAAEPGPLADMDTAGAQAESGGPQTHHLQRELEQADAMIAQLRTRVQELERLRDQLKDLAEPASQETGGAK